MGRVGEQVESGSFKGNTAIWKLRMKEEGAAPSWEGGDGRWKMKGDRIRRTWRELSDGSLGGDLGTMEVRRGR